MLPTRPQWQILNNTRRGNYIFLLYFYQTTGSQDCGFCFYAFGKAVENPRHPHRQPPTHTLTHPNAPHKYQGSSVVAMIKNPFPCLVFIKQTREEGRGWGWGGGGGGGPWLLVMIVCSACWTFYRESPRL